MPILTNPYLGKLTYFAVNPRLKWFSAPIREAKQNLPPYTNSITPVVIIPLKYKVIFPTDMPNAIARSAPTIHKEHFKHHGASKT